MIEPQNGEFLGYLNETANVDIYNDNDDITSIQFIFTVITDNDYFLFDQVRKKWNSYSAFGSLLEEKKDYLAGLIS
jgi:hypothetical protein